MSFPKFWERNEKTQQNVSLCESGVLNSVSFRKCEPWDPPLNFSVPLNVKNNY